MQRVNICTKLKEIPSRHHWATVVGDKSTGNGNWGVNEQMMQMQRTHCCCCRHLCSSWGKPADLEGASAAGGACGSRSRSALLSVCAAWRCWWSSRWHRIPNKPQGIQCWEGTQTGKRAWMPLNKDAKHVGWQISINNGYFINKCINHTGVVFSREH